MVSPWGPALLPGDIHSQWQLGPPPSENQIAASGSDRTPYAKAQRSPSIRWQTSQPCVRNFWSKIDCSVILLSGCSLYGCGGYVDYSAMINRWTKDRINELGVYLCLIVCICCFFLYSMFYLLKCLYKDIKFSFTFWHSSIKLGFVHKHCQHLFWRF